MNIVFNSSLPRSGSTLLQNLLSQNGKNYCSPTNDLLDLVVQLRNSYGGFEGFRAQGLTNIVPRIKGAMRGLIEGFYSSEINRGKSIIDKSRGYLAYIELLEEILEKPLKVICCVRDIREIVASFERLHRNNQLTKIDGLGDRYFECQTIEGRMMNLLSSDAVLGLFINRLRDVFDRGLDNRLIIVPYSELVNDPVSSIMKISVSAGLNPFICSPNNIQQQNKEDDSVYGMNLHTVRKEVNFNGSTDWKDYLPERLGQYINNTYPFLQKLANVGE